MSLPMSRTVVTPLAMLSMPSERLGVNVHVEQAGQNGLAGSVDALGVGGHLHGARWADRREMIA